MSSTWDAISLTPNMLNHINGIAPIKVQGDIAMLASRHGSKPTYAERINERLKVKRPKSLTIRKLSYFSDNEGKTRVIGILDYWSQTLLKPIHDSLNGILRKIPEDCTFDQASFHSKLPTQSTYYSFDLSNATDRLPALMQRDLLEHIYDKNLADNWYGIMVSEPFVTKGSSVKYQTGQPMGAYSS